MDCLDWMSAQVLGETRRGVKVRICVEIETESPSGFDDGIRRALDVLHQKEQVKRV